MARVTILGAGFMGSATAWPLRDNGHEVRLVGTHLDDDIIDRCRRDGLHPKLRRSLPDGVLPYYFSQLDEALEGSEIIVSGVNSNGVHWIADVLGGRLRPGQRIIGVTKGLEVTDAGEVLTFPELIESRLPAEARQAGARVAAIGGPCIAGELAGRRQTCVVFGAKDLSLARGLADLFRTSYYHIWPTAELLSLEVGVALKNAYTLGVGLAYGLLEKEGGVDDAEASMHNLASALFAQGTSEIHAMIRLLGGAPEFAFALPGAGDLYVTTMGGRTVRLGRLLGQGKSYEEAREIMRGETLESVQIIQAMAKLLPFLRRAGRIADSDFPMMRMLIDVVVAGRGVEVPLEAFFQGIFR